MRLDVRRRDGKSLPVLARWRRILLDPNTPIAAAQVGHALGDAHRLLLHGEPDARLACQIIAGDGLRLSPHQQARWGCAYQLRWFTTVCDAKMGEAHVPCPPEALLAAGDLAAKTPPPDVIGRWNQLYVYAFSVGEAVASPPFAVERSLPPEQQDLPGLLAKFSAWWATYRPAVEAQVAARADNVDRLRKQLEEMAR